GDDLLGLPAGEAAEVLDDGGQAAAGHVHLDGGVSVEAAEGVADDLLELLFTGEGEVEAGAPAVDDRGRIVGVVDHDDAGAELAGALDEVLPGAEGDVVLEVAGEVDGDGEGGPLELG